MSAESLNGSTSGPVDRVEFESVKGRVQALEWRADHTDGRVLGVDGAEQDLREQVRGMRKELAEERKLNAEFRNVMLKRVPSLLEKRAFVGIAAAIAAAAIKMALQQLGIDLPDVPPELVP